MMMQTDITTAKYYSRLYLLPRGHVLGLIYLGLIILIGFINSLPAPNLLYVFNGVIQYLFLGAIIPLIYSVLLISRIFNPKRVIGLSTVILVVSLPAELIFARILGLKGVGLLASSGLVFSVLSAFYHPLISFALASVPPVLAFKIVNDYAGSTVTLPTFIGGITTSLASILLGIVYVTLIEVKGRGFGFSPLTLTRSFMKTWFVGDPRSLEVTLSRYAEVRDLLTKAIILNRENGEKPIALVFPTLHYGPFRNIGSSRFIYHLEKSLGGRIEPLIFHTPGSHEHNLVSNRSSKEIAASISEWLMELSLKKSPMKMCKPFRARTNGWEAFALNGPSFIALFISNKVKGNDDLPYELWDISKDIFKGQFVVALADSHSFKDGKVKSIGELKELLVEASKSFKCLEGDEFKVGYGIARARKLCRGICDTRVKALTLNFNGERYGLIYIYGNNMDGGYNKELNNIAREMGLKDVEIITPDDHSCAASFKESPYDIVMNCKELTDAVQEAIKKAISSEVPATYITGEYVIKGVKYMGDRIWDMMEGLEYLGELAEKLILGLALLINLTPLVLYIYATAP